MDEPPEPEYDKFVTDLGRSGLVSSIDETLRAFRDKPPRERNFPAEITKLAGWLINEGILTYWQYTKLCKGQWKGFILDGYKILDHLGVDEDCSYYLAENVETGRRVALRITPISRSKIPGKGRIRSGNGIRHRRLPPW